MSKMNELAATKVAGLPATLVERMQIDAGKGVSTAQEDNLVPLIYVLQALSPQVNKRNSEYLEGAEPGAIWLRNSPTPIVNGDEGIIFQPCHFSKDWVEWVPRDAGGGFVGRHPACPADAKRQEDPKNPNKVKFVRPNGNEVMETRYHVGFVVTANGPLPYVIPMSSSGHTASKQWMFMMNSKLLANNKKAASFAYLYRLKTKQRTNALGTWFTWDISDEGMVQTVDEYDRGCTLYEAFASGAKQVEAPAKELQTDTEVM